MIAATGREGLGTVLTRSIALVALAGGAGLVHSLFEAPLVLTLQAAPAPAPVPDPVPTPVPVPVPNTDPAQPAEVSTPTATDAAAVAVPAGPEKLDAAAAFALFDQGAQFVDARRRELWLEGRVAGAWQMIPAELRNMQDAPHVGDALAALDPGATTVVYCVGGDCEDSVNVAILLQAAGFTDLRIMGASFEDWQNAGYPTESGDPAGAGGMP